MKKLILIIWRWNEMLLSGDALPWKTANVANELWLADISDNIEEIANYIKRIPTPNGAEILVFLHETSPHGYNRGDQKKLNELLEEIPDDIIIRSRLFSSGQDRIYFGGNNLLGIIGVNGKLASKYSESLLLPSVKANLVLDTEMRIVNDAHFDHVWNAYWDIPKDHVYRLSELFNYKTRGYEWQNSNPQYFISHLRGHSDLWQQLHSFAGIRPSDGTTISDASLEYNLDAYVSGLGKNEDKDLCSDIESARSGIKNLLENGLFDGEPCEKTRSTTYNALFDLFKKIDQKET